MKDPHRVDAFECFFCWAASEGLDGGGHTECSNDRVLFGEEDIKPVYKHTVDVEILASFNKYKNERARILKISRETGIHKSSITRRLKEMGLTDKYPAIDRKRDDNAA